MNDAYVGYGRDKCAYSRDLNAAGYEFYVLPEAFVINRLDEFRSNTMYDRSAGVQLRMFLSIAFHAKDLEHGHLVQPSNYNDKLINIHEDRSGDQSDPSNKLINIHEDQPINVQSDDKLDAELVEEPNSESIAGSSAKPGRHLDTGTSQEASLKVEARQEELDSRVGPTDPDLYIEESSLKEAFEPEGSIYSERANVGDHQKHHAGIDCDTAVQNVPLSDVPEMTSEFSFPVNRKDVMVERLMEQYGVHTYVEIPTDRISGSMNLVLPLMQPDVIIAVLPESDRTTHAVDGLFETYVDEGSLSQVLEKVNAEHDAPKLFMVNAVGQSERKLSEMVFACLSRATDDDVIVFESITNSNAFLTVMHRGVCKTHRKWIINRISNSNFLILRASESRQIPKISLPPLPNFLHSSRVDRNEHVTTDVILFSRNRPLQTFAFFDSLTRLVTGVNKVWILLKSDDTIFDSGYDLILECFSSVVKIEIVRQEVTEHFGNGILQLLRSSEADFVVIAVDEIIWLRPVDLQLVASLMQQDDSIASFQLRLGENILNGPSRFKDWDHRFVPLKSQQEILAFYPRRLPYDFGYVLNVDGVVVRRNGRHR